MPFVLAGLYSGCSQLQNSFGSQENFFEGTFTTRKDADAIAEFYQAEDLLRIIAVHPFFFNLFMNKVDWDPNSPTPDTALLSVNETHAKVKLLGMEVSFEIVEEEEEGPDGEARLASFNRHERFLDWVPILADYGMKVLLWDQTWNFGFKRLPDGSLQVYHRGEKFYGPWPVRVIVSLHQRYVLWACKNYINGDAFGTDDIDAQQEQMANIPLHVFHSFISTLRREKARALEVRENETVQDEDAIARERAMLEKLDQLSGKEQSSIALAKRAVKGGFSKEETVKVVASDPATKEALESAMKDAKGNRAVNSAVQEMLNSNELEWRVGRTSSRSTSQTRKAQE